MIIDCHTHLYPPFVYDSPETWADQRHESYWLSCVKPRSGPHLQAWSSVEQMVEDMDSSGVDIVVSLAWYWEQHATCIENLEWQLDIAKDNGERILFFAPFNAKGGDAALELITRALENGFQGVGELNPPAQGYAYDDPVFDEAIRICAKFGKPITLHVTELAGRSYPGKIDTPFNQLQSLARRHPDATFIFAHLGGLLPFYEMNEAVRSDLKNVYYDTAAIPLLYDKNVYRKVVDCIGSERILFGTDYPLRTYPSKQLSPDFRMHLAEIEEAKLNERDVRNIFAENAIRLFNLSP